MKIFNISPLQHHQLSTHFISCHAVMEAYGVATMRNLPDAHPVYKLLRPHFRYTMAINHAARRNLINNGGIIDQLFSIGGKDDSSGKAEFVRRTNAIYDVHWTNIRKDLTARGISPDDNKKLPNYFYRDDGVRLWDAIETFVASILDIFYTNDKAVEDDSELKNVNNIIICTNSVLAHKFDFAFKLPKFILYHNSGLIERNNVQKQVN